MRPIDCALESDTAMICLEQDLRPRHLGVLWKRFDCGPVQTYTLVSPAFVLVALSIVMAADMSVGSRTVNSKVVLSFFIVCFFITCSRYNTQPEQYCRDNVLFSS